MPSPLCPDSFADQMTDLVWARNHGYPLAKTGFRIRESLAGADGPRILSGPSRFTERALVGRLCQYGEVTGPWLSRDGRPVWQRIVPGAFGSSVQAGHDVVLCYADRRNPLARGKNGTLRLREENGGLVFDAFPEESSLFQDVIVLIRRGDLVGLSFSAADSDWSEKTEGGRLVRTLRTGKLDTINLDPMADGFPAASFIALREQPSLMVRSRQAFSKARENQAKAENLLRLRASQREFEAFQKPQRAR